MAHVEGLRCRECGREYDIAPIYTCEWCFGPLEVAYDLDAIRKHVSRETIAAGPHSIWRYACLLPVEGEYAHDLGAGFTPLVRADRLAAELGLGEVWLKNDTQNPTNSFKDRVTAVALATALEFGFKTVACASTGNLAKTAEDPRATDAEGCQTVGHGRASPQRAPWLRSSPRPCPPGGRGVDSFAAPAATRPQVGPDSSQRPLDGNCKRRARAHR